jgi:hypothetical protein
VEYLNCLAPISHEKRKVNHCKQDVLGEENRHIISKKFAGKVLKQEPGKEKIHTGAPPAKYRHYEYCAKAKKADVRQAGEIVGYNVLREKIGASDEETQDEQRR